MKLLLPRRRGDDNEFHFRIQVFTSPTHHLSGLEGFSVKVCEAGAVVREPITLLQLLVVTRGLVAAGAAALWREGKKAAAALTLVCMY